MTAAPTDLRNSQGIARPISAHRACFQIYRNYGKSAALSVGIEKAAGDIIVTMDADLQDDPTAIPEMVRKINEGYDLVSGWKKKRHHPLTFTIPSKLWNAATSLIAGVTLHDFNCGFKAYRANVAKGLEIYGERHRYLPVLAHWDGYRVTETPVVHHARKFGKSKYGFSKFYKGIFDLLTILFLRKYMKNPMHFFGMLGILFGCAGGGVLVYFGVEWALNGHLHLRPLVLLALGAIIMGIQFISIGLIGEMLTHFSHNNTYTSAICWTGRTNGGHEHFMRLPNRNRQLSAVLSRFRNPAGVGPNGQPPSACASGRDRAHGARRFPMVRGRLLRPHKT